MAETNFVGKQFGKYFILEKLAVGGMAEIYKAKTYGAEGFEKLLAIKRILPHAAEDKDFINMLVDEAKLSVVLSHANIVQVFDLGKVGNDYFISMEFIHGVNLRDVLYRLREQNKKLPMELAAYVASEVSKGLDYAHRKTDSNNQPLGIVHRDISPQNILISYEGEVKIVDFGIAKAAMNISHTMAGILKGKIAYMSPEQAMGKTIDGRTDLFSLGIVLYECLTGKKLYTGESQFEVLKKIRTSRIDANKLPPTIPAPLKTILVKSLAFNIEERYPSAGDMQVAMTKYLYATYTDFSPRKLANFVKELFAEELKKEKQTQEKEVEAKTSSISFITGRVPETIVHRETESGKASPIDTTRPILSARPSTTAKSKKMAVAGLLAFLLAGGLGWGLWKFFIPKEPSTPVVATGTLHITSDPQGANIFLNGQTTDYKTPAILDDLELEKNYLVGLALENFGRTEKMVRLENTEPIFLNIPFSKPSPPDFEEPVALPSPVVKGSLFLETNPGGAKIFLDGLDTGKVTPAKLDNLEVGKTFALRFTRDGFEPLEKIIRLEGANPVSIIEGLTAIKKEIPVEIPKPPEKPIVKEEKKKPEEKEKPKEEAKKEEKKKVEPPLPPPSVSGTGNIQVASRPSGADVFINGENRGTTPLNVKTQAGTVKVLITKGADIMPCRETVQLRPGETATLTCELGPLFGKININSEPPRADVYFNGNKMEGKTPMVIKKVKRDKENTLRIELNGYRPWSKAFDLRDSETKSFNVELEK